MKKTLIFALVFFMGGIIFAEPKINFTNEQSGKSIPEKPVMPEFPVKDLAIVPTIIDGKNGDK